MKKLYSLLLFVFVFSLLIGCGFNKESNAHSWSGMWYRQSTAYSALEITNNDGKTFPLKSTVAMALILVE